MHANMTFNRKEPLILLLGDLFFFLLSLWLTLAIRKLSIPSWEFFLTHLRSFIFLFVVWIIVFYISGLYEKHTSVLKSKLAGILLGAQAVNSGLAVAFFYLVPFLGITPKTILFIYLIVSFVVVLLWRRYGYMFLQSGRPINAILIGSGSEMKELLEEVNENPIYNIRFISSVDLDRTEGELVWKEIVSRIYAEGVSMVVIDLSSQKVEPVLPHLYNLIFSGISFIEMHKIYEDIFDRVPLSLLRYDWFLENISTMPRFAYDMLKRFMDVVISFCLLIVTLPLYPFIALAIKLDDGGSVFINQNRIGQGNRVVRISKFRSMKRDDSGNYEAQSSEKNIVTKVGLYLRKSRLDELPQLWSVLMGNISLIGPRPELPSLVKQYENQISYYNVRHLIKPGLSGWAQIYHDQHPHHAIDTEETKNKLTYDLYYIKNRSFLLDIKIALRTLKTLVSITGR
jgi:exopolysaccharide biosynthesis polyprenyl glycosylphosphotransferase